MSDTTHITYLFGAGASYGSMPVVAELNTDLAVFANNWREHDSRVIPRHPQLYDDGAPMDVGADYAEWIQEYRVQFDSMIGHINGFATVDTLAKFWTATKNDHLVQLKAVINLYFGMRHFTPRIALGRPRDVYNKRTQKWEKQWKLRFDPRYDGLIAGLVSAKDGAHDSRVSYLSYNYDLELEQSLLKFRLNAPNGADSTVPIYHINGTCTNIWGQNACSEEETLAMIKTDGGDISYAWENVEQAKDEISTRLAKTTHLVVIGYSFPVFNREVDRQILAAPKLAKIYLQDLPDPLKGIKNRVEALLGHRSYFTPPTYAKDRGIKGGDPYEVIAPQQGVEIELIDSVDQFHIPFEIS